MRCAARIIQLEAAWRNTSVKRITGTAPDLKAKIAFDSYGEKLLLLKYAKMRVI